MTHFLNKRYLNRKFKNVNDLTRIDLCFNKLETIDRDVFYGLKKLRLLDLQNNELERIDPQTFNELKNLQEIWLSSNRLKAIHKDTFLGLKYLQWIVLYNNKLQLIDPDTFTHLENLQWIDLHSNQLHTLVQNTFTGLVKLKEIWLDNNLLQNVDKSTFTGLVSLEKINLSNNQLTTLDKDTFSGLVNLRELRLDDNQIQTLDKDILRDLTKLEWIGVSNNQLETLDSDTFAGLNKAQEIYLHNNKFGENLELNLEESVKFISFRTGQDQWDPSNDIEFISKPPVAIKIIELPEEPQLEPSQEEKEAEAAFAQEINKKLQSGDVYIMDGKKRGIALIIDNQEFSSGSILNRVGSELDAKRLEKLLASLKFEVHRKTNQTAAEIRNLFDEYSKSDYTESDCFLAVVLTHGVDSSLGVFGTDLAVDLNNPEIRDETGAFNFSKFTSLVDIRKEVYEKFSENKSLADKPKIFFVNASAANQDLKAEENATALSSYKRFNDFFIDYSTVDDSALAERDQLREGSVYVQALTETLAEKYQREHLTDLITITHRITFEKVEKKQQQPYLEQSLLRKVYFL